MQLDHLWPPPTRPTPTAPTAPRSERVRRAIVATVAAGTLAAVIGIERPGNSVGIALVLIGVGLAALRAGVMTDRSRVAMLTAIVAFVPWLAVRASPWLLIPDLIAATALALVATSARNSAGLADSATGYHRRLVCAVGGALAAPRRAFLGVQAGLEFDRRRMIRQSVGPAALGIAIALAVAFVLASGDALFRSFLEVDRLATTTMSRFIAASVAMAIVVAASGAAAASERRPPIPTRPRSSASAAIIASVPLVAVYVAYVAVQCSTLLLGADYVRDRTGLTFAEYARSGFFQLVGVALFTFLGLTLVRPIVRGAGERDRRILRGLAMLATGCTLAMVVAAIVKLDLYADAFGLTMLRVYTVVFAAWLGLALLLALWSLVRLDGEWLVPTVAVTALAGVFAMNVVNPERIVAEHNLTETIASEEFDIGYLLDLSSDAVPTIADHLEVLAPADRDAAVDALCDRPERSGWLDWNRSAARAREHAC